MEKIDYRAVVHYKTYPRFEKIPLKNKLTTTKLRKLIQNRRTRRESSKKILGIETLHSLLNLAAGRTGIPNTQMSDFRAYPSAGARYPLELYIVSFKIDGLDSGIYHFSPLDRSLELLWKGDYLNKINGILDGALYEFESLTKAFLIITSIEKRTTYKYGVEGKIFPYIEAGFMGANISLLLEEIGINTVVVGVQWCDEELGELLDLNPMNERVISGITIL